MLKASEWSRSWSQWFFARHYFLYLYANIYVISFEPITDDEKSPIIEMTQMCNTFFTLTKNVKEKGYLTNFLIFLTTFGLWRCYISVLLLDFSPHIINLFFLQKFYSNLLLILNSKNQHFLKPYPNHCDTLFG